MSSAGVKAIAKQPQLDAKDPGAAINNVVDHFAGKGNIFSENDPNNKKTVADGDPASVAADLGIASRDTQFALRDQSISTAAQAAGAQRSENDADLLGFVSTAKRRSASRTILG